GGTGTGPDATAADVPARLDVAARAGVAVLAEQREADAGGLGADALASRGQAVLLADLAPVAGEVVEHGVHRGGRPGQLDDLLLAAPFPDALLGVAGAQLRDLLRVTALVLALLQVVLARAVGGLAGGVSLHLLEEQDQAAQHHRVDQQRLLHVTRSPCARGEDAPADTRTPAGVPVRSTGSTPPPDAPTLAGAPERPAPITPGARRVRKATDRPGEAAPRLPANGGGGPGEAGAERGEDDQPAPRDVPLGDALRQGQRDAGGGGVAVALDVVEHLVVAQLQALLHRLGDAEVGLVRDEQADVARGEVVPGQRLAHHLRHLHRRVLEDLAPVHPRVVARLVDHPLGEAGRVAGAGALRPQVLGEAAVGVEVGGEDAAVGVVRRLQAGGARAVAEDDGHVAAAGGDVQAGGVHLGAHQQHLLVLAGADPRVRHRQAVDEAAALVADVERGDARHAQLRL